MKTKQEKNLQRLNRLRLLDDDFMNKAFEDLNCTKLLLQIILNKPDLNVQRVQTQSAINNLQGRSVRLDILAADSQGNQYNVEVQRNDKGAQPKRARYFKEDDKGVTTMCEIWDEVREEGREEGKTEERENIAKIMLQAGKLANEDIAEYSGLTLATVQSLAQELCSA